MKLQEFTKKVYKVLSDKLIATPKGNAFSVLHNASRKAIDEMTGEKVNLYCPLSATKDKQLDLTENSPTQISVLDAKKRIVDCFELRKKGILEFNLQTGADRKFEDIIFALSCDLYVEFCKNLSNKKVENEVSAEEISRMYAATVVKEENQEAFLEFISNVDAFELVSTSGGNVIYSNSSGYVERLKKDANYRNYKAVLLGFSSKDEDLKNYVDKFVRAVKKTQKVEEETIKK